MNSKPRKPSRAELLKELESIRTSLMEESLGTDSDELISEDLTRKNSLEETSPMPKPKTEQLDEHDYLLDIPEPSSDTSRNNSESDILDPESSPPTNPKKDDNMTVLPGQQSLFEEPNSSKTKEQVQEFTEKAENPEILEEEEKAENPFLPKHVKDRLEKERALYQKEIDEASKASGLTTKIPKSENQHAIVDELVAMYLPKIEQELRERLKRRLKSLSEED